MLTLDDIIATQQIIIKFRSKVCATSRKTHLIQLQTQFANRGECCLVGLLILEQSQMAYNNDDHGCCKENQHQEMGQGKCHRSIHFVSSMIFASYPVFVSSPVHLVSTMLHEIMAVHFYIIRHDEAMKRIRLDWQLFEGKLEKIVMGGRHQRIQVSKESRAQLYCNLFLGGLNCWYL